MDELTNWVERHKFHVQKLEVSLLMTHAIKCISFFSLDHNEDVR